MKSSGEKKIFLSIETTTGVFSLAIGNSREVLVEERIPGRKHSEKLITGIKSALEESKLHIKDIDAVSVGTGPGSLTGIRIGVSAGVTLAQILDVPLYGISSMDIAGKKASNPVIKAFRDKYYHAEYDEEGNRVKPFHIIDSEKVDKIGGVEVEISPAEILKETEKLYEQKADGNWKEIEPVYVMDTVYKEKKKGSINKEDKNNE
ncbi:tRNA (adenosine(37)-N6)-threonylcarbamoyltransferase complex dimerization subunit type 1 TsaB [Elusimicrobiota bacterium]